MRYEDVLYSKIRVNNPQECKRLQKALFKLGCGWNTAGVRKKKRIE